MKKILLLTFLVFNSFIILAQNSHTIKIKVDGIDDSLCILAVYYGDKQYVKDTGMIDKKGYYAFKGKDTLDQGMYILAGQKKNTYFEFFITEDQNFTLETDTLDFKKNMKIKGSKENSLFFKYLNFLDEMQAKAKPILKKVKATENKDKKKKLQAELNKLNDEVENYQKKLIKDNSGTFTANFVQATLNIKVPDAPDDLNDKEAHKYRYSYYKNHYWDNYNLADERLIKTPFFHKKLKDYFEKVLIQSPDTIILYADSLINIVKDNKEMFKYFVWYITRMTEVSKIMGMDKAFVHMAENYYLNDKAFWASSAVIKSIEDRAKILKSLLIGEKAPNLIMVDTSFKRISVYDTEADYLIVLFYDPDCGHCKKEIAKLKKFYKDYKQKNVEVFAIYSEADVEYWKDFVKEKKLNWINAINGYNIDYHTLYDIISTPTIYLLDKDKKIIAKRLSAEQVIKIVKRDLGEEIEKSDGEQKNDPE